MNKKSELHLLVRGSEPVKSNLISSAEAEEINRQVSFDFHTCFDANNFFLQEQRPVSHFQKKSGFFTL